MHLTIDFCGQLAQDREKQKKLFHLDSIKNQVREAIKRIQGLYTLQKEIKTHKPVNKSAS